MNRFSARLSAPAFVLCAVLAASVTPGTLFAQDAPSQQAAPDAQNAPPPAERHAPNPRHEAKHLTKVLGLSSDQAARIEPIFANRDQQVQSILANTALSAEQQHAQVRAARKDAMNQVEAILTDQQNQQWQQIRAQHRAQKSSEAPPAPSNS